MNIREAKLCAYAAQAVYKDEAKAQEVIHTKYKLAGTEYVLVERDNTHCSMFLVSHDTMVLAFAGTDDKKDIRDFFDIETERDEICGGRIHGGFREAIDDIWLKILDELFSTKFSGVEHIIITGHSLGASLALIAAGRIKKMLPFKIRVYTFGCPRTGDRDFVKSLEGVEINRYVNNNDIVTDLPPSLDHYKHAGQLHYITAFGNIRTVIGRWIRTRDRVVGFVVSIVRFRFDPLQDHRIDEYVQKLEGFVE